MAAIAISRPYVPMARTLGPVKEPQPPATRELEQRATRAVFRAIRWNGEAPATPPPRKRPAGPDPWDPVRRVMTAIPWTGEQVEALTSHQIDHSVRGMLETFRWE